MRNAKHAVTGCLIAVGLVGCTSQDDPIVGDWRSPFSDGTSEELNISDSMTGDAYLYWYSSSWADWKVTVVDDGDEYVVTLRCPRDPDCIDAEPIVMTCDPNPDRMSCVGRSGGYDDNYAGATFDWSK